MQSVLVIIKYWKNIEIIGVAENLNLAKNLIFEHVRNGIKEDFKTDKEIEEFVKTYNITYKNDIYEICFPDNNDFYDMFYEIQPFEVIK